MNKKIRFSLLTLLVMLCGTVFADDSQTLTFNTSAGYAQLTVTKAGTSGTGSEMVVSKGDIIVTSALGYIKDHEMTIYKSGTMTVSLGDGLAGNHITKVELNVSNYHFSPNVDGWTAGDSYQTSSKISGDNAEEFTASSNDKTSITLTNVSNGKTTVKVITVYYAADASSGGDDDNTVANYTVDFNTRIATSAKDFAVASNWGHVSGYDAAYDSNMSYSWSETAGVDGTGVLLAWRQYKYDWGQSSNGVDVYDLLVTPEVKGAVSIAVKQYSGSNSYIEFYKMTDNGDGTFTRGDKIEYTLGEEETLSQSAYCTATINVEEFTRIGIRASYMYLDNFVAEQAIIVPEKAITIASADPTATTGTIYWDQQANGKVLVKYTVTVKNTGDVDLTQGTEGYSVSIFNRDNDEVYVTTAVPQNLAVGETSDPFVVQAEVETSVWPNSYAYHSMDLKENLKGTVLQRAQSHYNAYQSKFVFRAAESTATSSITTSEAWGTITESTTKSFEIYNNGLAPLTITAITLPEGFTSADAPVIPEGGLVVNGKESVTLSITQDAAAIGTFAGTLTISYLSYGSDEATDYTLNFSATIIGANTWTADFNNTKSTPIYPDGSIAEAGITSDYNYNSGNYDIWLTGRTQSSYATENNKFITPKLHANAGDALAYDVKGAYGASYYAKVYVSTDRQNWTQVAYYTQNDTEGAEAIGYSNWYTKQVNFTEAGDYYVAFALYGTFKIDNLVGLEKVDVAHDLYIKSVNWPDASVKSGTSQVKPSVDIIPLTDEAASAYTVKYVCGETVLAEGTSVELTASANSSKTFSFSWTPVVEQTTVYEGTKVVFDFGNGVTFETGTFDLTVTNEPIFHFVNSIPTSKWNEPSDRTAPIAFGKTNTADVQTFYVYNWGAAPLTVNSISVPAGFTVTPAEQFTVVAFDETNLSAAAQAVMITFSATEAGEYSGNMVINYGTDGEFTLPISGTKLDPTKFYANFDGGNSEANWPAGSVYQSGVSASNGGTYSAPNYYISSTSTTNNLFITPKLTAAAGDKLAFDAKLYSSSWGEGKVVVYAAATRDELVNFDPENDTRTALFSVSGQDETNPMTTDWQTFEVPALAGDNYYAFEISSRPYVDEIYGLKVAEVAHDWQIVSSNIPAQAMQNIPATVSVNLLNLGLQDEAADNYEMTVYISGDASATGETVALPMNHELSDVGTKISATMQSPKVGTFPVYIEVKAGDYVVQTDPVNVEFLEEVAVAEGKEVGTKTSTGRDYGFVDWYNNDGNSTRYTDILYPAEKIAAAGINAGDKIIAITFKGSNSAKTFKAEVTSWVGTSTGGITFGTPDKLNMQEISVYSGSIEFPANMESVINLTSPIVWDGTSDIRVYTEAVGQGTGNYVSVQYAYDSDMTMSYNGTTKAAPLAYFVLAAEPATFSGTVKDADGNAIENATVTLVSTDGENVQYTGTTDAEGAYSFNVIQSSRTYNATASAEGFEDVIEENISFTEGNQTKDFVLGTAFDLSTAIVNADFEGEYTEFVKPKNDRVIYQPAGWTVTYQNGEENDLTSLNSNCLQWNNFSSRPQLANGGNNTYWVRFRWGSSEILTLSQEVTLPSGEYRLTADAFFNGANGGSATISAAGVSTNIAGNSTWNNYSVDFTLTEETAVTIAFNVTQTAQFENIAAFDNFKLGSLLDMAKEVLQDEIAKAEALKTADRTEGLDEFNAAITTARGYLASENAATVNAAVEALKAAEEAFLTANLPMAEGTYYVYNPLTEKFLSRGNAYGTAAVVDDYGVAVNVAVSDLTAGKYTLSSFDNGANYGFDAWMYADAGGNNVRAYNINKVEGGVTLTNTGNNMLVYVYTNEGGDKYRVAGNAIKGDNYTDDAQTVWQFVTPAERDRMVASREAAAKTAAYEAAGFSEDDELDLGEATEVSFTTGHAWTQTVVRSENNQPATNDNGTEMWQATGNYTQTISDLPAGLYKVTIQAFYRNGSADEDQARVATGYNTVLTYLEANGNKVQVKSWTSDKGDGNDPNSMAQAKAKFDAGKYLSEVYTCVGADGKLNLTVNNPAHIGNGWFIVGNVKYAKVEESVLAGDVSGDGEVTTNDAVAVIPFVLEQAEPTPAQFKAADVNKSNTITISDAVGIVNIALNWNSEPVDGARGMVDASNDYIVVNGSEVGLMNATTFVGFQMDVTLSEGAQFNGAQLTARTMGHQVAWNRVADRTYRVVVFSAANEAIASNEGALLQLNISGNQQVSLGKIEFTDADARAYTLGVADPTGIRGITADQLDAQIYTVGGVRSDKVRKGMNVIRQNNGKVTKRFVK